MQVGKCRSASPTLLIKHDVIGAYLLESVLILFFFKKKLKVEYKHMTPTAALEYVRSRRPRVLLAPAQWRVRKIAFVSHLSLSFLMK